MKRKHLLFLGICLLLLSLLPRLSRLESHWSSDEVLWLDRSSEFMSAIKRGDFSETRIAYHPGVPTMWLAGLRTFFTPPGTDVENLAAARWFIGIVVWIGIGIACLLLYKLFGQWVALASFACLAYSPFFLAQTRRVHTDALATLFILLTVLLFLMYCQHRQSLRYLVLSGMSFGLAILSKSYSLILLPWLPLCLFLFRDRRSIAINADTSTVFGSIACDFWKRIAKILCFLNCSVLTVVSLWPVFWPPAFGRVPLFFFVLTVVLLIRAKKERYSPYLIVLTGIVVVIICVRAIQSVWMVFDSVSWAVTTPHEVEHFFLGKVVHDPGWLFYPFVLTIKSTPLMLPLALVGFILLWKQRTHAEENARRFKIGVALVMGVLLFTVCLSATSKKFSRYLLPAFALLEILAGIGLVEGLKWIYVSLGSRFGRQAIARYKKAVVVLACVFFFSIQVLPVFALHPYYGTYYNLCWKVTDITKIITVGDASGLDIAANYLNRKPKAYRLIVQVSPLVTEFVRHYFVGIAYPSDVKLLNATPDYEVVYIRDSQIGRVPETGTRNGELESVITLNGIEHVWIYRIPKVETP